MRRMFYIVCAVLSLSWASAAIAAPVGLPEPSEYCLAMSDLPGDGWEMDQRSNRQASGEGANGWVRDTKIYRRGYEAIYSSVTFYGSVEAAQLRLRTILDRFSLSGPYQPIDAPKLGDESAAFALLGGRGSVPGTNIMASADSGYSILSFQVNQIPPSGYIVAGRLGASLFEVQTSHDPFSGAPGPEFIIDLAQKALAKLPGAEPTTQPVSQPTGGPSFKLGFKMLADQIPDVVGQPLEDEHWGENGDSLQLTTTGLMVWRKADNWTAFTNGART